MVTKNEVTIEILRPDSLGWEDIGPKGLTLDGADDWIAENMKGHPGACFRAIEHDGVDEHGYISLWPCGPFLCD